MDIGSEIGVQRGLDETWTILKASTLSNGFVQAWTPSDLRFYTSVQASIQPSKIHPNPPPRFT